MFVDLSVLKNMYTAQPYDSIIELNSFTFSIKDAPDLKKNKTTGVCILKFG
jgi:hypothetical protein